jgi:deoxyribodipyrimidine photolyase
MTQTILWVRNDLRLLDNYSLCRAVEAAKREGANGEVLPVLCLDPRSWIPGKLEKEFGMRPIGPARAKFRLETIEMMQKQLFDIDSDLVIVQGEPEKILSALCKAGDVVVAQDEPALPDKQEQEAVAKALSDKGCQLELVWNSTTFHRCVCIVCM